MEGYRPQERREQLSDAEQEWVYEKVDGQWRSVQVPRLNRFSVENQAEIDRRDHNLILMLRETGEQRNFSADSGGQETLHEGILRHHPEYEELFKTWAIRWLRQMNIAPEIRISNIGDEGEILDQYGDPTGRMLVDEVEDGRAWIDEQVEHDLRISEGFVNATPDGEDPQDLAVDHGVEPRWWMYDRT